MANYKGIKGFKVQSLASDPSLPIGQVWYNTAGNVLKYQALGDGTWASGGAIGTGRYAAMGSGISTAGLVFGGSPNPGVAITESYTGTAWSEVADLNQARNQGIGAGSQAASLCAGGQFVPNGPPTVTDLVERWDGTSWTEIANLTTAVRQAVGCGTTTAALNIGGSIPAKTKLTEDWNGTSWTEVADLNTERQKAMGAAKGTPSAALFFAGMGTPTGLTLTESWNGTSWSEVADLNVARSAGGGAGTQTDALCIGGAPAGAPPGFIGNDVENFNGTSWTAVASLAAENSENQSSSGTGTDAYTTAGQTAPTTSTEVWARAAAVKTVTVS